MKKPLYTDQIINKILLHLLVSSLFRFRFVCKSWRSLINDPIFIDTHLKKMEFVSNHLRLFQIVCQLYPYEGLRSWCYVGSPCDELIHPGFPVTHTKQCTYELLVRVMD
ncbi:hypothetical protein RDI58_000323 [Solanum bulbocastanum]|uniref:F-box domain-containing protein n=1 Tax=Solanum bulbocastanum TaxID=147425 RepID=A0AAN8YM96_SOLBU